MSRRFAGWTMGSVELFCLTAELQGFTAAARAAGLTPAAVSRSVARLEARLGVRLFARTTRLVRLTEAGRRYFEHCRLALGQLAEAEQGLGSGQRTPAGRVRVSLPSTYGHYRVLPVLGAFRARYPEVQLELQIVNRNVDFAAEGFDLAIRARKPPESGLVARKLEDAEMVVVASPSYLRRNGTPRSVDALADHACLQTTLPSSGQAVPWLFRRSGRDEEHAVRPAMVVTDDVLGVATLARHGAGLAQTFRFVVAEDLRANRLREVLKDVGGASRPFSLIYPANRYLPSRVRVLVDFLVERLASAAPVRQRGA